jgi:hypothetical protein
MMDAQNTYRCDACRDNRRAHHRVVHLAPNGSLPDLHYCPKHVHRATNPKYVAQPVRIEPLN